MARRVNIEGRVPIQDAHYRYTMPVMEIAYEKSWTILPNLAQVGNALHRDFLEIQKYMSVELCSSGGWKDGRPALKSRVPAATIHKLLRQYIQDFCLCANCHLPETAYRVRHGKILLQKCFACGAKVQMSHQDHKVCTYIVQEYAKRGRQTTTPRTKKLKDGEGGAGLSLTSTKEPSHMTRNDTKKKKQKSRSDLCKMNSSVSQSEHTKPPGEGRRRRPRPSPPPPPAAEEPSRSPSLMSEEEEENEEMKDTPSDVFEETVNALIAASPSLPKEWARCAIRQVRRSCSGPSFLTLSSKDSVRVLLHAWFRRGPTSEQDSVQPPLPIDAIRILLEKEDVMRRYMERYVVESLEEVFFVELKKNGHAITFVRWLKSLWEEDLVSQETLFVWAEDPSTLIGICANNHRRLLKASRPLLIWLAENEEEQDSSDDEP